MSETTPRNRGEHLDNLARKAIFGGDKPSGSVVLRVLDYARMKNLPELETMRLLVEQLTVLANSHWDELLKVASLTPGHALYGDEFRRLAPSAAAASPAPSCPPAPSTASRSDP